MRAPLHKRLMIWKLTTAFLVLAIALELTPRATANEKLPQLVLRPHGAPARCGCAHLGLGRPWREIEISIAGQTKTATADADKKWMVKLGKLSAGGDR